MWFHKTVSIHEGKSKVDRLPNVQTPQIEPVGLQETDEYETSTKKITRARNMSDQNILFIFCYIRTIFCEYRHTLGFATSCEVLSKSVFKA